MKQEEHEHQKALFVWAGIQQVKYPELRLLFAIPNGGHRHPAVAAKLKAEGVKAGIPDVCLPVARCGYHGLYVELKKPKGGKTSPDQHRWASDLGEQGYRAVVAYGWVMASQIITNYLEGSEGEHDDGG